MRSTFLASLLPLLSLLASQTALGQTGVRAWSAPVAPCNAAAPSNGLLPDSADPLVFQPDSRNGFVIEIEWAAPTDSWVAETRWSGFSGASYYRWAGPNLFSTAGRGVLTYRLRVAQAGRYRIVLHNRHNHPDSSLENDCWIRANGSGWTKLYSNTGGNSNVWNFHSRFDPGHGLVEYNLNAGLNTIELSGRSANFMIDRLHVFPSGTSGYETLNVPRSQWENSRPILGTRYVVRMGDPSDSVGLTPGSTLGFWLISPIRPSGPCGVVLPEFGPGAANGEYMLAPSLPPLIVGPVAWNGPSSPARFSIDVPNDPGLIGDRLYTQGLLIDAAATDLVLTPRLDVSFGDV